MLLFKSVKKSRLFSLFPYLDSFEIVQKMNLIKCPNTNSIKLRQLVSEGWQIGVR